MSETTILKLQSALDRFRKADLQARNELIGVAYQRLSHLASRMLNDYRLRRQGVETGDVLNEAMLRLLRALEEVRPQTARDFLALAAMQIRRELVDLTRRFIGRKGHPPRPRLETGADTFPLVEENAEPDWLAAWTELHERIAAFPAEEREVVDLVWYLGLPKEEAAKVLNVDKSTVKRRWRAARDKLKDVLQGWLPQK